MLAVEAVPAGQPDTVLLSWWLHIYTRSSAFHSCSFSPRYSQPTITPIASIQISIIMVFFTVRLSCSYIHAMAAYNTANPPRFTHAVLFANAPNIIAPIATEKMIN